MFLVANVNLVHQGDFSRELYISLPVDKMNQQIMARRGEEGPTKVERG